MSRVNEDYLAIHRARRARVMNLVAVGLFITALLALFGFHVTEWESGMGSGIHGWVIWPALWSMAQAPDFSDTIESIGLIMFPSFVVLAVCSPFLIGVLRKSRLAWWLLVLFSGTCLISVGLFAISESSLPDNPDQLGPGFFCLANALAMNFLGMLFVRRDVRVEMPIDSDDAHSPTAL